MPRTCKGPRLWKRPVRRKDGRFVAASVWIIKDGGKHIATGCLAEPFGKGPPAEAERALAAYISDKYKPPRKTRDVDVIDIADVLSIYHQDSRGRQASPEKFDGRIERLNDFFGGKILGEINSALCAAYVKARGNSGGARRDLEDLRAAIGHHARENLHHAMIHVTLPEKGGPRERWLTREEAARLLWTCWRAREAQTIHRGLLKGQKIETDKRPLRHIARFLLIGLYTGTRAGAIASASPERKDGRSFVDLDRGIFYRLAQGKRATNKRQPPVPIPGRLLAHMRRWARSGGVRSHFVEWNGQPVKSVKTGFATAVRLSGLSLRDGNISPHTLRHTAATWLMQRRADPWQASGFLGMSVKVLLDTYGHHHPDYMREAAAAITSKEAKQNSSVVETVVDLEKHLEVKS
ncbi:putative Integrase family protein [Bradyrhizobium sp. ORS 285]|uniref:site-specific integrase n=1 Tax=Bradyrhizobium sp. ORS 285 TaxID=115808 RepID=UPI0002409ADC|nr:site-specific integrase [Bradyrhizobium sp. ORS 285]CCD88701.1 putative Phage integrase [Bradyrhizobium sp. ORS 285]SMX56651.1 putative Integrase family protein [Bradyrhizobium sp. ORS 285]